MSSGMWMILGWSAFVMLTGTVLFVWGWLGGQFKDVEEAKYRILEDREPEPWPDRTGEKNHG